ncbi:uncharacterized protein LOC124495990 [Dermatophagoides farinae]|uniref:FLYWCH-type domain-containing protein n=1 Tax=Dermatophagoides farinae TaxID=6954 RepID=A0A922I740_DERFA|nr:uncharacterized protein LOC124495990 [Dermatophagoides farinae]KAH7640986.1 hypothetical protein HUG17_8455 [Dermatophagoides farinae]KAH9526627.1 hypothetical protein DERF_000697 [Dermatophagoides farinae]
MDNVDNDDNSNSKTIDDDVYIVESQRGGVHLIAHGYHYRYDRKLSDGITDSFRCSEKNCRGRLFKNGDDIKIKHEHDHAPDMVEMQVRRTMIAIKECARTTNESAETIIATHRATLPPEVNEQMPKDSQIIRTIGRLRSMMDDKFDEQQPIGNHQYMAQIVAIPDSVNFICADNNQQFTPHHLDEITIEQQEQQQQFVSENTENNSKEKKISERKQKKLQIWKQIEMNRKANINNNRRSRRFYASLQRSVGKNQNSLHPSNNIDRHDHREDASSSSSTMIESEMNKESKISFSGIVTNKNNDTSSMNRLSSSSSLANVHSKQPIPAPQINTSIIGTGNVTDKEAWALVSRLMIYFNQDGYEDSPIESLDECLHYIQKRMRAKRLQQQQQPAT